MYEGVPVTYTDIPSEWYNRLRTNRLTCPPAELLSTTLLVCDVDQIEIVNKYLVNTIILLPLLPSFNLLNSNSHIFLQVVSFAVLLYTYSNYDPPCIPRDPRGRHTWYIDSNRTSLSFQWLLFSHSSCIGFLSCP